MAPGATTIMFSAFASTMIAAVPLGPGTVITPSVPTSFRGQVSQQRIGGRVRADGAHELHFCARAGRGDGLVGAFAARPGRERRSQHGFAR